jgi:hypothetical protein
VSSIILFIDSACVDRRDLSISGWESSSVRN